MATAQRQCRTSASSRYRQNALASWICRGVRHSGSNTSGDATKMFLADCAERDLVSLTSPTGGGRDRFVRDSGHWSLPTAIGRVSYRLVLLMYVLQKWSLKYLKNFPCWHHAV